MNQVPDLLAENAALREQLAEAEAVLEALRSGAADAIVVGAPGSQKVFALEGAETPYRIFVESMREGAAAVDAEGCILYANEALARLAKKPLGRIIGSPVLELAAPEDRPALAALLGSGKAEGGARDLALLAADDSRVRVRIDAAPLAAAEPGRMALLFASLTDREEAIAAQAQLQGSERSRRALLSVLEDQSRAQALLRDSEARFRALMEHASDLVVVIDAQGIVRYASPSVRTLGGYDPAEVDGTPFTAFMHPEEAAVAMRDLAALVTTSGGTHAAEFRYRCKDGRWIVLASMAKNALDDPAVRGIVLNAHDVTERRHFEQQIERQNRMLSVLSGIDALIVRVHDVEELYREACRIVVESGRLALAWLAAADADGGSLRMLAHAGNPAGYLDFPRPLRAVDERPLSLSVRALASGRPMACNDIASHPEEIRYAAEALERGYRSVAAFPLVIAGEAVAVLTMLARDEGAFDETEMRLLEQLANDIAFAVDHIVKEKKVEYLAYYDSLTGLPRASFFMQATDRPLAQAAAEGRTSALVVGDLERFRNVNDTLGRTAGDALLAETAQRVGAALGTSTHLARMHADVFAFLLFDVESADAAVRQVREMAARCFSNPVRAGEHDVPLEMRFGIALSPADGTAPEELYRNAESALKRAKESGDRLMLYSREMNARVAERLGLEARLRKALEDEQFELHYQAKFDSRSGAVAGLEALLRWKDPRHGRPVSPAEFVPVLEETGLILPVGAWALARAARQACEWRTAGLPAARIAVNVSALQLRQRDFVDTVLRSLEHCGGAPCLDIEITESLIMRDVTANIAKLKALRDVGIGAAIDDFGTGYSSLAYIARLPIDTLKIDRSFIVAMADSGDSMGIVASIITLAHQMNLKVVAEGVETEEQAKLLRLLKCDQMQGYLFAKPMPAAEVAKLLALPASQPGGR